MRPHITKIRTEKQLVVAQWVDIPLMEVYGLPLNINLAGKIE